MSARELDDEDLLLGAIVSADRPAASGVAPVARPPESASAYVVDVGDIGSEELHITQLVDRRNLGDLAKSIASAFSVSVTVRGPRGEVLARSTQKGPDAPPAAATRELAYDGRKLGVAEATGPDEATVQRALDQLALTLELIAFSGHRALLTSRMHLASIQEAYRELVQRNEELTTAYEKLKELDRLKSNFLATVSHELRTPLTSIMGYADMLGAGIGGELSEEQQEFVNTILAKSQNLLDLITALLDLGKLESGTLFVRKAKVAIAGILADVRSTAIVAAQKAGVKIEVRCAPDLRVLGDEPRLRQIFGNLVDNAVKFSPNGGLVSISASPAVVSAEEEGAVLLAPLRRVIEIRVADTGVGIPDAEREKIFQPFYQVDSSSTREFGGAGLGLAVVQRLVDAHGGSIRVEANQPRGTVFVVSLPEPDALSDPPPASAKPRSSPRP